MNKLYVSSVIIAVSFLFSFSTNPPDGNTGAPGEQLCLQCHIHTNPTQNGTIAIEGFPASITPNETYTLTAINRLTEGTAVRAGFQVTILGPFNTRAGDMSSPSTSSALSVQGGRQYWDHNPAVLYPDSNVVRWTVNWKAPDLPDGSKISWYAAGNIANGNFQNTGDRVVAATGSGNIILSATDELTPKNPIVFPNPGTDHIRFVKENETNFDGTVVYYNLNGEVISKAPISSGYASVPLIPSGVYLLKLQDEERSYFIRWTKI